MTIGIGVFNPQPRFVFTKSYVRGINFATYLGNTVSRTGNTFRVQAVPPDPTFLICRLRTDWFVWNSNQYTLDWPITEFWYKAGGVGPEIPFNYSISWVVSVTHHAPMLQIEWFPAIAVFVFFPMPQQPLNYWLPKPLP